MCIRDRGKLAQGNNQIWFAGEFGFRYYLEAEGGRYLTEQDNSPAPGDYVILSHDKIAYFISDELKNRMQLDQSIDYPAGAGWPIRVQDRNSQAGFYDQFVESCLAVPVLDPYGPAGASRVIDALIELHPVLQLVGNEVGDLVVAQDHIIARCW